MVFALYGWADIYFSELLGYRQQSCKPSLYKASLSSHLFVIAMFSQLNDQPFGMSLYLPQYFFVAKVSKRGQPKSPRSSIRQRNLRRPRVREWDVSNLTALPSKPNGHIAMAMESRPPARTIPWPPMRA
jgi:hypothetical protein